MLALAMSVTKSFALPLLLSLARAACLPPLVVAVVNSDELEDDAEKLPPDRDDMLEAKDVLVLTMAMLSSSIFVPAERFDATATLLPFSLRADGMFDGELCLEW